MLLDPDIQSSFCTSVNIHLNYIFLCLVSDRDLHSVMYHNASGVTCISFSAYPPEGTSVEDYIANYMPYSYLSTLQPTKEVLDPSCIAIPENFMTKKIKLAVVECDDFPPTLLPNEIFFALVDYIPTHMYDVCAQTPYFASFTRLHESHSRLFHLIDAIKRNEVEYCKKALAEFETTRFKYTNLDPNINKSQYISKNFEGQLSKLWFNAIRYGRLDILELIDDIYAKTASTKYYPYEVYKSYETGLLAAPNIQIINRIINRGHLEEMIYGKLYALSTRVIEAGQLLMLEWLYSHIKHGLDHNYLHRMIRDSFKEDPGGLIKLIKKVPEVTAWVLAREWDTEIKDILNVALAK
jgi:hypothetical protein